MSDRRSRSATWTMPSGSQRLAAGGVLGRRQPEEDDGGHAHVGQLVHLLAERVAGVLEHAGQRRDLAGRVGVLADEQRDDEVVDRHPRLGDEPAQGGRAAQPAEPALRKAHGSMLRRGGPVAIDANGEGISALPVACHANRISR